MRYSQTLIPTLKQDPADAEVVSHKLMVRAGMIRQIARGIYDFLPLGLRVVRKVEQIVREEMDRAGAQEILMPAICPAELWQESGRWEQYGKELLRMKDRYERDFCFGPTHEEVVTDIVRREVRSYRELPINLYQIQVKFRDEVRPRFGLMRGREFIMKDAYSFHADAEDLPPRVPAHGRHVPPHLPALRPEHPAGRIRHRRHRRPPRARIPGARGFRRRRDRQLHEVRLRRQRREGRDRRLRRGVAWHTSRRCAGASEEGADAGQAHDRGGRRLPGRTAGALHQDAALHDQRRRYRRRPGARRPRAERDQAAQPRSASQWVAMADAETVERLTGAAVGFAGPIGLRLRCIADAGLRGITGAVTGANETDYHFVDVDQERDFAEVEFADLRLARAGDPCPRCDGGVFEGHRGIEVGNIFYLGTKYSAAMNATYLDAAGQERPIEMGCYGIGITRTAAAAVEQYHDDQGIIWPLPLAPFHVHIVPVSWSDARMRQTAEELYAKLQGAGVEVLLDDRDERPGIKFKDADLIGVPLRVTIGAKSLERNCVEFKRRGEKTAQDLPLADAVDRIAGLVRAELTP